MPNSLPAAVLWDMDGTLVDSESYWIEAEQRLVARDGGNWTHQDAMDVVGSNLTRTAQVLRERGGVQGTDEEIVAQLVEMVIEQARDKGLNWRPGARALLAQLVEVGVPCAMVTMSYSRFAEIVAAQAPEGAFRALVTGDTVSRGKPHPEPYLRAAQLLGVDIRECIAIEDSNTGIQSAEAAGAKVIGVKMLVHFDAAPGRSRFASLEQVGLAELSAIADGAVIDLLD